MELAEAVSLVVFYLGAFFMPLIANRFHVPAAVGEILYGLVVGGSTLGLVHRSEFTDFLAELGFIFLMFLVGMEIDFNRVEREGNRTVLLAFLVALAVLVSGGVVAHRLGMPLFMALVLGAMSVGVLLVALVEAGVSQTRWGQLVLLVGSIGEFLTLIALTGFDLVHSYGVGWALAKQAVEVFLLFVVAFVLLVVLKLAVWWFPHSFQRWVDVEDPSELGVRFGFVLMLGLSTLAAWVGLEAIVGAFLAGMLLTYVFRESGVLETKLAAVGQGFFVPIFFINVGVSFEAANLAGFGEVTRTVLLLAFLSLLVKLVPTLLLMVAGVRFRAAAAGAFLLATPLTLLVAVAALGLQMGFLDSAMSSAIILMAIVTGVLFPTLFKLVSPSRARASATSTAIDASRP